MKYFIRAVKYFFYIIFFLGVMIVLLILSGAAEGGISTLFRGGYNALWRIAVIFAAISAIYPKVGFMRKEIGVQGDLDTIGPGIIRIVESYNYSMEGNKGKGSMTFRKNGILNRITRMYEDRITISSSLSGITVEGLRKDVARIASGLEARLNANPEE